MSQSPFRLTESGSSPSHKIPIWDSSDPYRNPPSLPPAPKSPTLNTVGSLIQSGKLGTPTKGSLNGKSTSQLTISIDEKVTGIQHSLSSLQSRSIESKDSLEKIDSEFRALNKRSMDNYASLSKLSEHIKNSESYSRKVISDLDAGVNRIINKVDLYREGHHNSSIVLDGLLDNWRQVDEKLGNLETNLKNLLLKSSEVKIPDHGLLPDHNVALTKIQQEITKYLTNDISNVKELGNTLFKTISSIPSELTPLLEGTLEAQSGTIKSSIMSAVVDLRNSIVQEITVLGESLAKTHNSLQKNTKDSSVYVESISSTISSAIKENSTQLITDFKSIITNDRLKSTDEIIKQLEKIIADSKSGKDEQLQSIHELAVKVESMETTPNIIDEVKYRQQETNDHILYIRNMMDKSAIVEELTNLIKSIDRVDELEHISKSIVELKSDDIVSTSFNELKALIELSFKKLTGSVSDKLGDLVESQLKVAQISDVVHDIKLETAKMEQYLSTHTKNSDTLEEIKSVLDGLNLSDSLKQSTKVLESTSDRMHTSLYELLENKLADHKQSTNEVIKQVLDSSNADITGSVRSMTDAFRQDEQSKTVINGMKDDLIAKMDDILMVFTSKDQDIQNAKLDEVKSELVKFNFNHVKLKAESDERTQLLLNSHESALKISNDKVSELEKKLAKMEIRLQDSLRKEEGQTMELESYKQKQEFQEKQTQKDNEALEKIELESEQRIKEISDKLVHVTAEFESKMQESEIQRKELQSLLQESNDKLAKQAMIIQEIDSSKNLSDIMTTHMKQLQTNMETLLEQKIMSQLNAADLEKKLSESIRDKEASESKLELLTSQLEAIQVRDAGLEEQITKLNLAVKSQNLEFDIADIERRKAVGEQDIQILENKKQVLQVELKELLDTIRARATEFAKMEANLETFERKFQECLLERSKNILGAATTVIVNKEPQLSSALPVGRNVPSVESLEYFTPHNSPNELPNISNFITGNECGGLIIPKGAKLEFGVSHKKQRSISLYKPASTLGLDL